MPLRFLVSIAILLLAFLVLFLVLIASETALTVWHYLKEAPLWVQLGYAVLLLGLPLLTVVVFWGWLRPGRRKKKGRKEQRRQTPEALQNALLESANQGIDVSAALEELREQQRRQGGGEVYIAVYGEVSSGKSSLVNALLPEAEVESDPRAGTTTRIRHFAWQAPSGDRITIADLPGFNLADDSAALEECRRAHLVIFLCDADLTGSQVRQLRFLLELDKPVILALNKADRYSTEELESLLLRIGDKTALPAEDIVAVSTGGREEVVRLLGAGIEQRDARAARRRAEAARRGPRADGVAA